MDKKVSENALKQSGCHNGSCPWCYGTNDNPFNKESSEGEYDLWIKQRKDKRNTTSKDRNTKQSKIEANGRSGPG
ncbi:putative transcriptional regulatory protein [Fusarium oxysporum f. sp. albedinis]|nr:putative transcriptional regulatory protein [Fusarium oxysporum f. sp. albedinis]